MQLQQQDCADECCENFIYCFYRFKILLQLSDTIIIDTSTHSSFIQKIDGLNL